MDLISELKRKQQKEPLIYESDRDGAIEDIITGEGLARPASSSVCPSVLSSIHLPPWGLAASLPLCYFFCLFPFPFLSPLLPPNPQCSRRCPSRPALASGHPGSSVRPAWARRSPSSPQVPPTAWPPIPGAAHSPGGPGGWWGMSAAAFSWDLHAGICLRGSGKHRPHVYHLGPQEGKACAPRRLLKGKCVCLLSARPAEPALHPLGHRPPQRPPETPGTPPAGHLGPLAVAPISADGLWGWGGARRGSRKGVLSSAGPGSPSAAGPSQGLTQMGRRTLILLQASVSPAPPPKCCSQHPSPPNSHTVLSLSGSLAGNLKSATSPPAPPPPIRGLSTDLIFIQD